MTQAQLTVWRNRLLSDWAQVRETLIGQLKACRRDEWAEKLDHCEQDQLVELTSRLDLPKVEQGVAHLKRIDAALCQMDLGLYGLCSDCEEPLAIESLEQDPTLQCCPRCEAHSRSCRRNRHRVETAKSALRCPILTTSMVIPLMAVTTSPGR